jgi:putative FmdB family regulatory protein
MPIYEYRCEQGHTFDVMQRMNDDPVSTCQVCEAPVSRVFRPPAVHFKGSGFYNTDYGTRKRAREKSEHAASSAESKKSESSNSNSNSDSNSNSNSKSDSKSSDSSSTSKAASSSD